MVTGSFSDVTHAPHSSEDDVTLRSPHGAPQPRRQDPLPGRRVAGSGQPPGSLAQRGVRAPHAPCAVAAHSMTLVVQPLPAGGVVTLTGLRRLLINRHIDARLIRPLSQQADVSPALLCLPYSRRLGHLSPGLQACSHLLPVVCCSQEMPPWPKVRRDHAEGGEEALSLLRVI